MNALPRICLLLLLALPSFAADFAVSLPPGVTTVWTLDKAWRDTSPARERLCINGLWRWQPGGEGPIPDSRWGYFKVPGPWPGITDYMQKDCQTLYPHPSWKDLELWNISAAWHQREIDLPASWANRRILLSTTYLNSFAVVYVDGRRVGELRFPAGELDLTDFCRPGQKQLLTLFVTAMPLKGVLMSYTDSASARQVKGTVPRRGLCGDLFLEAIAPTPRLADLKVRTSFRSGELACTASVAGLAPNDSYELRASIRDSDGEVAQFQSSPFGTGTLTDGRLTFSHQWKAPKLWDIHTPENKYSLNVSLVGPGGHILDQSSTSFGFRELWINGRDFYLNGTRLFLSAVPLDNAQVGVAWSTYQAARESLERLKSIGINFVYTHNYGCEPGSHLSFEDVLRAADDVGILVALSQPHFSHYEWKSPEADRTNGYATHARFYASVAGNHPSVVFYSMSHNGTGYWEDMNPDLIGVGQPPRDQWSSNNVRLATRAEAIVNAVDPDRIIYHHASGNLGSMHPMNFYPNFVPPQELSDWFGPWSTNGLKPAFLCEYGAPFTWDWTMYRGWYKGQREFGSAMVPWEFCLAEWNAQFVGDRAYNISEYEKVNLRWEAKQFRAGNLWHRWDYPFQVGSTKFDERYPVFALYLVDNWRAFRGWGVSAISPWEYEHFWKLRDGVNRARQQLSTDWNNLQRPGYSPDYIDQRYERVDLAFERKDWLATPAAEALLRHNRPLLAFIAGKAEAFTSKDHNFKPGESVQKQVIIINNSRETVRCTVDWTFGLPQSIGGASEQTIPTGEQVRVPVSLVLPTDLHPGSYLLRATVRFSTGETQQDSFAIDVVPGAAPSPDSGVRVALWDPRGETQAALRSRQVAFRAVQPADDLSAFDLLLVGKGALDLQGPAPDISRVRQGLKLVIFEQSSPVLEKRFGFRTTEYGLRQVFPRVPDHPLLAGISPDLLHDWRGDATILPPRLTYETRPRYGPTVQWCDLPVTRLWRCGNRGNVASVLIEKPTRGDFLPILDGGYASQYSPLLEYREGKGLVLFCQLDLTGRTETDPAAETLLDNILNYITHHDSFNRPPGRKSVVYAGVPEGKLCLEALGFTVTPATETPSSPDNFLVLGPRAQLPPKRISDQLSHGSLLAIGLSQAELSSMLGSNIKTARREHISSYFDAPPFSSPFRGIAPADLHNRVPQSFDLITAGADILGDGVIAASGDRRLTFFQMPPWLFRDLNPNNVKRTFRRSSFALSRLLANLGAESATPLLTYFHAAPDPQTDKRWLTSFYLDKPEEWDDPYRFFRW